MSIEHFLSLVCSQSIGRTRYLLLHGSLWVLCERGFQNSRSILPWHSIAKAKKKFVAKSACRYMRISLGFPTLLLNEDYCMLAP